MQHLELTNETSKTNTTALRRVKRDIRFYNSGVNNDFSCYSGGCAYYGSNGNSVCTNVNCHCDRGSCAYYLSTSTGRHCQNGSCSCKGGGCRYHAKPSDCGPRSCTCPGGSFAYNT